MTDRSYRGASHLLIVQTISCLAHGAGLARDTESQLPERAGLIFIIRDIARRIPDLFALAGVALQNNEAIPRGWQISRFDSFAVQGLRGGSLG